MWSKTTYLNKNLFFNPIVMDIFIIENCPNLPQHFFSLLQLASVVIFGVGVYANIEKDKYLPDSGVRSKDLDVYDVLFDLTVIFIIFGLGLFVFSFLGCIGALRENTVILNVVSASKSFVSAFKYDNASTSRHSSSTRMFFHFCYK